MLSFPQIQNLRYKVLSSREMVLIWGLLFSDAILVHLYLTCSFFPSHLTSNSYSNPGWQILIAVAFHLNLPNEEMRHVLRSCWFSCQAQQAGVSCHILNMLTLCAENSVSLQRLLVFSTTGAADGLFRYWRSNYYKVASHHSDFSFTRHWCSKILLFAVITEFVCCQDWFLEVSMDQLNLPGKVKIQDRDILATDGQALIKFLVGFLVEYTFDEI